MADEHFAITVVSPERCTVCVLSRSSWGVAGPQVFAYGFAIGREPGHGVELCRACSHAIVETLRGCGDVLDLGAPAAPS